MPIRGEKIQAGGRCPTPERIRQQRQEQEQAIQILRRVLGRPRTAVTREQQDSLWRLGRARGLPAR